MFVKPSTVKPFSGFPSLIYEQFSKLSPALSERLDSLFTKSCLLVISRNIACAKLFIWQMAIVISRNFVLCDMRKFRNSPKKYIYICLLTVYSLLFPMKNVHVFFRILRICNFAPIFLAVILPDWTNPTSGKWEHYSLLTSSLTDFFFFTFF